MRNFRKYRHLSSTYAESKSSTAKVISLPEMSVDSKKRLLPMKGLGHGMMTSISKAIKIN